MKRGSRRATIQLKGAIIGIDDEDDCTFTIRDQTRVFHFQGETACIGLFDTSVVWTDTVECIHTTYASVGVNRM